MGDLVGDLGRAVLDEEGPEGWPEFLPYVLQCASSGWNISGAARVNSNGSQRYCENLSDVSEGVRTSSGRVVTGLRLMSAAAEHAGVAAAADANAFQALVETLQRCMRNQGNAEYVCERDSSPEIRLEAVRALGSMVVNSSRPSDQEAFAACLPHLLQAIKGESKPMTIFELFALLKLDLFNSGNFLTNQVPRQVSKWSSFC